jgi:hypothetical protein
MDTCGQENRYKDRDAENIPTRISDPVIERRDGLSDSRGESEDANAFRPRLPPRPNVVNPVTEGILSISDSHRNIRPSSAQNLQSKPTTALSLAGTNSQTFQDSSREVDPTSAGKSLVLRGLELQPNFSQPDSGRGSDAGDSASVKSYIPGGETTGDEESIFGDLGSISEEKPIGDPNSDQGEKHDSFDISRSQGEDVDLDFRDEFDPIDELQPNGQNGGMPSCDR